MHHPERRHRTRIHRALATVAVVALAAVSASACGGSDDDADATSAVDGTLAPTVTVEASGDPVDGGEVVYGIEAESDGWNPTTTRWALSGSLVALAVYDPLAAFDDAGRVVPYLAEEISPSPTFNEWTIRLRPGVTFHDGQPLTSEAVKLTLEGHVASTLTGPIVAPVDRVEIVDELTAVVVMKEPWSAFPAVLTGQVGMVAAPSQLTAGPLTSANRPVGTGPFVFDKWEREVELTVRKNESYWRDGLPHLDRVTFRPIPDPVERVDALGDGSVDVLHVNDPASIAEVRELAAADEVQAIADPTEPEELFLMLNNGKAPFDDRRAREAVVAAVDVDRYLDQFGEGIAERATGPFSPESKWYVETDWDEFDLERATQLVAAYEDDNGPMTVQFNVTDRPDDRASAVLLEEMLEAAGIDVELRFLEQGAMLLEGIAGTYDVALWRQWSAPDPDVDYLWWHSSTSRPVGEISINVGRVEDAEIDAALDEGRGTIEESVRKDAYAALQERLTEQVPYVWIAHAAWTIAAANDVRDIPNGPLPDGQASLPFGGTVAGVHRLTQVWIEP